MSERNAMSGAEFQAAVERGELARPPSGKSESSKPNPAQKSLTDLLDEIDWLSDEEQCLAIKPRLVKALRHTTTYIEILKDGSYRHRHSARVALEEVAQLLREPAEDVK